MKIGPSNSFDIAAVVKSVLVSSQIAIDDMLCEGYVVYFGAIELRMLGFAILTREYFEFIDYIFIFILEIGVELIVHGGLIQYLYEFVVVEVVEYRIDQ